MHIENILLGVKNVFFAEHRHTGLTCFSQDKTKKKIFEDLINSANENGVKVHQYLKNAPEHRFFFVLEAENYEAIHNFFMPVLTLGDIEVVPVINSL